MLSGGEPLFRPDLFDIGAYGVESGFRMALATNGTLFPLTSVLLPKTPKPHLV